MKILGLCGVPGAGKTTLMREFIKSFLPQRDVESNFGTLHYHQIGNVYILGVYRGEYFDGTDRLSMAVINDAELFLITNSNLSITVVFEGDRLWCNRFILLSQEYAESSMFLRLHLSNPVLNKRYAERTSQGIIQEPQFIMGRNTKYNNLEKTFPGLFARRKNDTLVEQQSILKEMLDFVRSK